MRGRNIAATNHRLHDGGFASTGAEIINIHPGVVVNMVIAESKFHNLLRARECQICHSIVEVNVAILAVRDETHVGVRIMQ